jgi:hypothetical protein
LATTGPRFGIFSTIISDSSSRKPSQIKVRLHDSTIDQPSLRSVLVLYLPDFWLKRAVFDSSIQGCFARFVITAQGKQSAQDQRNRCTDPGHLSAPVTQQGGKKPSEEGRREADRPLDEEQMKKGMLIGPSWQEGVSEGRGNIHMRD